MEAGLEMGPEEKWDHRVTSVVQRTDQRAVAHQQMIWWPGGPDGPMGGQGGPGGPDGPMGGSVGPDQGLGPGNQVRPPADDMAGPAASVSRPDGQPDVL